MKRSLLIASALLALSACNHGRGPPTTEAMVAGTIEPTGADAGAVKTLTATELAAMIERGEVVLIDVRTPEEFSSGRLPGALNAPINTFDAASIPVDETRETILYCRSSGRSQRAAEMLAEHIGGTVRHLEGGIIAWQEAGGEVIGGQATQ